MAWPDDAPTKDSTTMEANIPVFWDTASDGTVYCRDQHGKMHNTFTWSYLYNGTRDVRKAKAKEILNHYRQNASQTFSITPWISHDDAEPTITVRYNEGKAP